MDTVEGKRAGRLELFLADLVTFLKPVVGDGRRLVLKVLLLLLQIGKHLPLEDRVIHVLHGLFHEGVLFLLAEVPIVALVVRCDDIVSICGFGFL